MKRLFLTFTILSFVLASCSDSPVSNAGKQSPDAVQPAIAAPAIPFSRQPVEVDTLRKAAFRQFRAQNDQKWRVRWNKHTGLPASIFMGLTKKKYAGNAQQAGQTFLSEHRALLGVGDISQLKYIKTQTHRGVRHVTFQQTVKGVPVYEAEYKVHLRGNGQVDMVNGSFYPNIDVSTSPAISKSAAVTAARSDLALPASAKLKTTSKLVIYRQQDQFHLAWKLALFSGQPSADWFYMVDAQSGTILYKLNQLTDVTGNGDVYPTYPGLSSVTNKSFYRLNGDGSLEGVFTNIVNDVSSEAYSASNSFQYSSSNTHFDEANLYYHIDDFRHNFIDQVDDGSLEFNQITTHAHTPVQDLDNDGDLDPNAYFNRNTQQLYFNDAYPPLGTKDFAKEDKVIQHEYSHAVIYHIRNDIKSEFSEEGAISEGTPDYFAGSFKDRAQIGNYVVPYGVRDMDNPDITTYSGLHRDQNGNVDEEPHDGGEFFSSILWDLRNGSVGKPATDFLAYDALYRVTGDPNFLEFRDAMMSSALFNYSSEEVDDIQDAFAAKGLGSFSPPEVSVSGPTNMIEGQTGTWTATATSDNATYFSYEWYKTTGPFGNPIPVCPGGGDQCTLTVDSSFKLYVEARYTDSQAGLDALQVYVLEDGF